MGILLPINFFLMAVFFNYVILHILSVKSHYTEAKNIKRCKRNIPTKTKGYNVNHALYLALYE